MSLDGKYLNQLRDGRDFNASDAAYVFEAMLDSTDQVFLTSLLAAWAHKGAATVELAACAKIMRRNAFRVDSGALEFVDIVGTGGSRSKLFNISTASAIVAAGAGVIVAKHGNKAATSSTGSADALDFLGVKTTLEPGLVTGVLKDIGICFMFAPKFHNLKPELASARRSLKYPTLFNLVGPLANPAGAVFQLTGVWDMRQLKPVANAVADLGTKKTWIVHAETGLDEIAPHGKTSVAEIVNGKVRYFELTPEDFGIRSIFLKPSSLLTPESSADTILRVLDAVDPENAETSVVILNAAAAIYIAGRAESLSEAANRARESIVSGSARRKLRELVLRTNS